MTSGVGSLLQLCETELRLSGLLQMPLPTEIQANILCCNLFKTIEIHLYTFG